MLRLVDPALAREQYALARAALGRDLLGFAWATEWPSGVEGAVDIDSGPIVPLMRASPSSSGLALLAARSFGDDRFSDALAASLGLAAIPDDAPDGRRFLASNALGDAVVLAGLTCGPLWDALGAEA